MSAIGMLKYAAEQSRYFHCLVGQFGDPLPIVKPRPSSAHGWAVIQA
jgi:hypothetical protein